MSLKKKILCILEASYINLSFHPVKQSPELQIPRQKLVVEKEFHFDLSQKDLSLQRPELVRLCLQCTTEPTDSSTVSEVLAGRDMQGGLCGLGEFFMLSCPTFRRCFWLPLFFGHMELNQSQCAALLCHLSANSLIFFFLTELLQIYRFSGSCKKLELPQLRTCVALPKLWNVICRGKCMKPEYVTGRGLGKASEQLVCMRVFYFQAIGLITFLAELGV